MSAPAGIHVIQEKLLSGEELTPEEHDIATAHSLYVPPQSPGPEVLAALEAKIAAEGFAALSPAEADLALRALGVASETSGQAAAEPLEPPAPATDPATPVTQAQLVTFRDGLTSWVVEELTPRMTRLVERMNALEGLSETLTALDGRLKVLEQSSLVEQASEWGETFKRHAEQTQAQIAEQNESIVKQVDDGLKAVDDAYRERHDALTKRVDDLNELVSGLETAKADRTELGKAAKSG